MCKNKIFCYQEKQTNLGTTYFTLMPLFGLLKSQQHWRHKYYFKKWQQQVGNIKQDCEGRGQDNAG